VCVCVSGVCVLVAWGVRHDLGDWGETWRQHPTVRPDPNTNKLRSRNACVCAVVAGTHLHDGDGALLRQGEGLVASATTNRPTMTRNSKAWLPGPTNAQHRAQNHTHTSVSTAQCCWDQPQRAFPTQRTNLVRGAGRDTRA
jgi:hypothetical protein